MYGVYLRLGLHVSASEIDVIRAARKILTPEARRDPKFRATRKQMYRDLLVHHEQACKLYRFVMRGGR